MDDIRALLQDDQMEIKMKSSLLLTIMSMLVMVPSTCFCIEVTGTVNLVAGLGTNHISHMPAYFYSNAAPYVNGGVTFSYPVGFFTQTPTLLVTLSLLGRAYSTNEIIVAEVVSTTSLQSTVRVNVGSALGAVPPIFEASTNDVVVYLRAVGI